MVAKLIGMLQLHRVKVILRLSHTAAAFELVHFIIAETPDTTVLSGIKRLIKTVLGCAFNGGAACIAHDLNVAILFDEVHRALVLFVDTRQDHVVHCTTPRHWRTVRIDDLLDVIRWSNGHLPLKSLI